MAGKRLFDFLLSLLLIIFIGWSIVLLWIIASLEHKSNGLFIQHRIGRYGKRFAIFKIRTMNSKTGYISNIGKFLRKYKFDEFPQLINVLMGEMSFVGPRPDISGYYDALEGDNKKILNLRPGLTSKASLKYFNEEAILREHINPIAYNNHVLFPDKVKMNLSYYYNHSFCGDIEIICKTLFRYIK